MPVSRYLLGKNFVFQRLILQRGPVLMCNVVLLFTEGRVLPNNAVNREVVSS